VVGGCRCRECSSRGRQEHGASRSVREKEHGGAANIVQYHVFCMLQYQAILDDKKHL
jgi:hypothetical protein